MDEIEDADPESSESSKTEHLQCSSLCKSGSIPTKTVRHRFNKIVSMSSVTFGRHGRNKTHKAVICVKENARGGMETHIEEEAASPVRQTEAPRKRPLDIGEAQSTARREARPGPRSKRARLIPVVAGPKTQSDLRAGPAEDVRWLSEFAGMAEPGRRGTLTRLTELCSHEELVHLLSTIELQLKRDFVARLPVELSFHILSFLSARDLLACAQVSSRWRALSEDDLLWQRKCREAELELPPLIDAGQPLEGGLPLLPQGSLSSGAVTPADGDTQDSDETAAQRDTPLDAADSAGEDDDRAPEKATAPAAADAETEEDQEEEEEEEEEVSLRFAPAKAVYLSYCQLRCHWRNGTRHPPHVSAAHENHVITCLEFYKNLIISASDDSTIELRNARTYQLLHTLRGHFGGIWSSAVVERFLVTGSTDRTLRVWDLENLSCVAVLTGHVSTVRCLASSGKRVVSGSRDTNLRVWDVVNVRPICLLEGHRAAVRCVQFRDNVVVSGSYDSTVRVWDVDKKQCLYTLDDHVNRVYTLLFDGDVIISGSLDTTIRVYSFRSGALIQTLYGHQSLTSGMVLRRHQLISSNADGTVRVWDIRTGESSRILSGEHRHTSAVTCVQLVMNFVISAGDDGAVKLWDVQTGHFIRDLVRLDNSGRGGVVWRILANRRRLVCAAGSRNGAETTKLLLFDFEPLPQLHRHRCEVQGAAHCYRDSDSARTGAASPPELHPALRAELPDEEDEEEEAV